MTTARERAREFLEHEQQFHLGALPTEQPHPATRGLAETLQADLAAGIAMLQAVDQDVATAADRVFSGEPYRLLTEALATALNGGGRVCFSGCGATGRLSILLEARCRRGCPELAERVTSLMTGGDYALIRSLENFEDYASFGRQQVREAGLGPGDVLVAITEGGETSSVIGTVWEGLKRGAKVFFAFNNPADILARHVERSREVIDCDQVVKLDLATGPMAVAGSTRMQATTAELLAVGAALETAAGGSAADAPERFRALLADLSEPDNVRALAAWVDLERSLYAARGRVTYYADDALLDIFTDTTERAPTFMLPPFRKCDDPASPPSWAFVKDPSRTTEQAWRQVLGRAPRCLRWDAERYRELAGPEHLRRTPPELGPAELLKFRIGREDDPSRYETTDHLAMAVLLGDEARGPEWWPAFARVARPFARRGAVVIGPSCPDLPGLDSVFHIRCRLAPTRLGLWERLAVKLVLNTVSTATMGALGRLVSNWMAHVEATNKKLIDRGTRLVSELAEVDYETACYALLETMEALREQAAAAERVSPVAATIARLRGAGGDR